MKTLYPYLALTILTMLNCITPGLHALDVHQINDYKQRLDNPDPAVRIAAMDELSHDCEKAPESITEKEIAMVMRGMRDPEPKVRYYAVAAIAEIAMQTAPAYLPLKPGMFDYRGDPALKESLEKAIFDPDVELSRMALGAYSLSFNLSPQLQERMIAKFGKGSMPKRAELIECLSMCLSPSSATQDFLTRTLDDPEYGRLVVESYSKPASPFKLPPPPAAALSKFADMLMNEKDTEERQALARVLGRYGAQARRYIPEIKELENKETDATTRLNLHEAAEAIRTSK